MTNCKAITTNGKRCNAKPKAGESYCFIHDPKQAAARAQARRKGGQVHKTAHGADPAIIPNKINTIQDARQILLYTLQEILPMENSIPRARVLIALFDSYNESIKTGELAERLTAIESILKARE